MLTQLLALSSLVLSTCASQCDIEPTRIPIQDTQVLGDVEGSYMIGMRATFGSPGQSVLMLPWPWVFSLTVAFPNSAGVPHVQNRTDSNICIRTES